MKADAWLIKKAIKQWEAATQNYEGNIEHEDCAFCANYHPDKLLLKDRSMGCGLCPVPGGVHPTQRCVRVLYDIVKAVMGDGADPSVRFTGLVFYENPPTFEQAEEIRERVITYLEGLL